MEWIDIVDPLDEELESVAAKYNLSTSTFDETRRRAARPTLRRFNDHAYIVAFSGELAEIDMYLGPTWLITVRRHDPEGQEWDPVIAHQRFERSCGTTATSGGLLLTILDELIDGYFDATDELEDELEDLEERIFGEGLPAEREMQQDLFTIRRRLLELRRAVMPLRDVLGIMSRQEVPWVNGERDCCSAATSTTSSCAPSMSSTNSASSSATPWTPIWR